MSEHIHRPELNHCKLTIIKVFIEYENLSLYAFHLNTQNLSRHSRKSTNLHDYGKTKTQCTADQCLCFGYMNSTIPLLLNPKFQAPILLLQCLYSLVCVRPVQNPNCWFFSCEDILFPRLEPDRVCPGSQPGQHYKDS